MLPIQALQRHDGSVNTVIVVGDFMLSELPMQSVPITINVSLNLTQAIQHYVIKFVSDLRQVGGFLRELMFPPPIKLTITIKLPKNLVKKCFIVLNSIRDVAAHHVCCCRLQVS
jgi:hypothetical protein